MQLKRVKVNGLMQQLYIWGNPNKPKIFLYHGWLDTGASFHFLAQYLAKYYYCIAVDMRGYGRSEHNNSSLGYFFLEYVADVHGLLQEFAPNEQIRLIGHSLGGGVTSIYAGSYPERISHFINLEGFIFRHHRASEGPKRIQTWLGQLNQQRFQNYSSLAEFAKRLRQSNPRLPLTRAKFIAPYLTQKVGNNYIMAADPNHKLIEPYLFSLQNFYPYWKNIEAKCLLVTTTHSEMQNRFPKGSFKKEVIKRMKPFPKHTQHKVLKNCGHMMHQEKPKELAKILLPFLK